MAGRARLLTDTGHASVSSVAICNSLPYIRMRCFR